MVLEVGKKTTFAVALDWPGWARRDRSAEQALAALVAYGPRFRAVAGESFTPGELSVIAEVDGGSRTDFGVIDGPGPWDDEELPAIESESFVDLIERSWSAFDAVVASAPRELRKGPRGGGRDRDKITSHVFSGERAYASKAGIRLPASAPLAEHRSRLIEALRAGCPGGKWPPRYLARRVTWHVLDHLWEIEDRSAPQE